MTSPDHESTSGAGSFRFPENNFDLVRLVAAGEVAVRQALHFLAPTRLTVGLPDFHGQVSYVRRLRIWQASSYLIGLMFPREVCLRWVL